MISTGGINEILGSNCSQLNDFTACSLIFSQSLGANSIRGPEIGQDNISHIMLIYIYPAIFLQRYKISEHDKLTI
jgi:hypothetical protein